MKRITLLLAIFFTFQVGFAQEEVAIEQIIDQPINALVINPGWNVQLIQSQEADSSYRVAIITEEALAAFAYNVRLCSVKGDTLTILENTQLPKGTVVELEGPMTYRQISMMPGAVVSADRIITSKTVVPKFIYLGSDAHCHIQHLQIPDEDCSSGVDVWDRAQLTIDTISGESDLWANVYEGAAFQFGINNLNGKIRLQEYEETPGWHYQQKSCRIIKNKEQDGVMVTTDHRKVWTDALVVEMSFGIRKGDTPKDPDSPFLQYNTLSINYGVSTYFNLSNHWGIRTGLQFNHNRKSLCHQVKYEDGDFTVIDGQGEFQRNRLYSLYTGIPVSLYYYLGKQQTESVSLDFYAGRLIGEGFSTSIDPTRMIGFRNWSYEKVDDIFNPWKLEVGLSFNTQHLGFFHGIRVFTNLLPEYKPGVVDGKIRTVGVELKL
ncbi:MAG: PorT family protein [Bacteroidales bacterium]|nr:PorT family protein [Bacteroidales bacterium]